MSRTIKSGESTRQAQEPRTATAQPAFNAIALPAVAAATRRKPQGRTERRVGVLLDPARYTD